MEKALLLLFACNNVWHLSVVVLSWFVVGCLVVILLSDLLVKLASNRTHRKHASKNLIAPQLPMQSAASEVCSDLQQCDGELVRSELVCVSEFQIPLCWWPLHVVCRSEMLGNAWRAVLMTDPPW